MCLINKIRYLRQTLALIYSVYEIFVNHNYEYALVFVLVVLAEKYLKNKRSTFIIKKIIELFYTLLQYRDVLFALVAAAVEVAAKEGLIKTIGYIYIYIFSLIEEKLNYYSNMHPRLFIVAHYFFKFSFIFTI